jgi:3-(3-hydroxy-phenyl)propionate hydroxylase
MVPQPTLEMRDRTLARLDDIAGTGFALLAVGPDAQRVLALAGTADLGLRDARTLAILPMRFNVDPAAPPEILAGRDLDDRLAGAIPTHRDALVLVRPDRYVAAAAAIADDVGVASFAGAVRELVAATRTGSTGDGLRAP